MMKLTIKGTWLLYGCVGLTILCFACTYPISVYACKESDECLGHQGEYFLSNTINYPYASCIGSFLLSFGAMLLGAVLLLKHMAIDKCIPEENGERCQKINNVGVGLGVTSMVGAIGVCSFQLAAIPSMHYTFAALFFGGGLLSLSCFSYLDYLLHHDGTSMGVVRARIAFLICAFLCLTTWILMGLVTNDFSSTRYTIPTAVMEVCCFLCFEAVLASWYRDFCTQSLTLTSLDPSSEYTPVNA